MSNFKIILVIYFLGACCTLSLGENVPTVEVAKQLFNGSMNNELTLIRHGAGSHQPLRFLFNSATHINGWWCVRMYEVSRSWQDNYLCTNRDIGLVWRHHPSHYKPNMKCVYTVEPAEGVWHDNALCLPVNSRVELVWSHAGAVPSMKCILLFDSASPGYFNDNHLCWKEH